jgi:AraC-like DNA-binding protein
VSLAVVGTWPPLSATGFKRMRPGARPSPAATLNPLLVRLGFSCAGWNTSGREAAMTPFLRKSFNEVAGKHSQIFTEWDGRQYTAFLNEFYKTDDNKRRVLLLEAFLLTLYKPLSQEEILRKSLNQLTDFENECSIEEIAQSIDLNVRTFNRLFYKHFGISPVAFKKIARFRHSMKNKLFNRQFKTLTEIGYESNFYDQAYFNKIYKNITGKNHSKFFNSIEKLADDQLIFEFINK